MANPFRHSIANGDLEHASGKPRPEWLKALLGIALVPLFLGGFGLLNYLTNGEAKPANPQAVCLDSRYMSDILWEVRQSLRDPDSFEHIRSRATSVDENGLQHILIEFRARNGFGGMNIGSAEATVRFDGCKLLSWRLIEA